MAFICGMLLTGCMRYSTEFKIHEDGTADVSLVYAFSDEVMGTSGKDYTEELDETIKDMELEGWEAQPYIEDGYTGYLLTMENVDLDKSGDNSFSSDKLKIEVTRDGDSYIFEMTIIDDYFEQIASYKEYLEEYDGYVRAVMELPVEVKECNATEISEDGKTLIWDFTELSPGDSVYAEFDLKGAGSFEVEDFYEMVGYLMGMGLVVGGIIALIVFLSTRKKKNAPYGRQMGPYNQQMGPYNQQMGPYNQQMGSYNQQMGPNNQQMGSYNQQQPVNYTNAPVMPQNNYQSAPDNNFRGTNQTPAAGSSAPGAICPYCGAPLKPGSAFCGNCGHKLG